MAKVSQLLVREAVPEDAGPIDAALRQLSHLLGDRHRAGEGDILHSGFGARRAFRAVVAEMRGSLVGVALASPVYSTVRGCAGAFVSDLWVDDAWRARGIGQRLLVGVRDLSEKEWDARFIRLVVYRSNQGARAFYDRLGFQAAEGDVNLTLEGAELAALQGDQ